MIGKGPSRHFLFWSWDIQLTRASALSRYLWRIAEKTPTDWEMKGVAVAAYTFAVICQYLSPCNIRAPLTSSRCYRAQQILSVGDTNVFGALKVLTLMFVCAAIPLSNLQPLS